MSKEPSPGSSRRLTTSWSSGPWSWSRVTAPTSATGLRSCTAFSLPGHVDGASYQQAMDLGMRRSGTVIYRPLCGTCRKCQPLRVPVASFVPSRSQRRAQRRCEGLFDVRVGRPRLDDERLDLYARYQVDQHGEHAQSADPTSYRRFLVDTVTETIELVWREKEGQRLVGVGVLDVTPTALSSVYFYWEPDLRRLSLGMYSALVEMNLCRRWDKPYYYLGYLVPGSDTMSYKASFEGAEVWDGEGWVVLGGRSVDDELVQLRLEEAESAAMRADARRFRLDAARDLSILDDDD
jgi:leucyl-tRNA---protein transferase